MIKNIFSDISDNLPDELIEVISENQNIKIERIVSRGQKSLHDFWYDQDKNEFVFLVRGEAKLRFEDEDKIVLMKEGDYVIIKAHKRHRVEWTSPEEDTIWLSVHY
ncbi:cupin domain-containing protein [Candidatus Latescibacterota bacterium]